MSYSVIDRRLAARKKKRERRKVVCLWVVFLFLILLHVGLYVYFDEVVDFVRGGRDAVAEGIDEISN